MKNLLLGIISILFSFNSWAENNVCKVEAMEAFVMGQQRNVTTLHQYVDMLENCKDGQNLYFESAGWDSSKLFLASYCDLDSEFYLGVSNGAKTDNGIICIFKNHGNGQNLKERFSRQ